MLHVWLAVLGQPVICHTKSCRWMADRFYVMLTVRTEHRLREPPLFVRGFRLGEISAKSRERITCELKGEIDEMASEFYVEDVVTTYAGWRHFFSRKPLASDHTFGNTESNSSRETRRSPSSR